jgi:uncharacterized linocin/CFP29 family protein
MSNKFLVRQDAPLAEDTWQVLDSTMLEAARSQLAGRRLLHIEGPYGLGLKFVPLRDAEAKSGLIVSEMLPLVFIQKRFALGLRELANYERDGIPLDTAPVADAAIACAHMEDDLIFNGGPGAPGLLKAKGANEVNLSPWTEIGAAAEDTIKAVTTLDGAGFHGPYTMALSSDRYNLLYRRYPQGNQTEMEHLSNIVTDGIYKAPVLQDGGVLLASGRQFATIVLGQDLTVGFVGPGGDHMEFFVSESLALRVRRPQSICVLKR